MKVPACMTGSWSNVIPSLNFAICTSCEPGRYGRKIGATTAEEGCAACPPGTYSSAFGAASQSVYAVVPPNTNKHTNTHTYIIIITPCPEYAASEVVDTDLFAREQLGCGSECITEPLRAQAFVSCAPRGPRQVPPVCRAICAQSWSISLPRV
jgi:hypothetical protein